MKDAARLLMTVGALVFAAGALLAVAGRLPGDLVIGRGSLRFYVPLGTCLLISAIVSVLAWLLRR
jgi:hypothetical protein